MSKHMRVQLQVMKGEINKIECPTIGCSELLILTDVQSMEGVQCQECGVETMFQIKSKKRIKKQIVDRKKLKEERLHG